MSAVLLKPKSVRSIAIVSSLSLLLALTLGLGAAKAQTQPRIRPNYGQSNNGQQQQPNRQLQQQRQPQQQPQGRILGAQAAQPKQQQAQQNAPAGPPKDFQLTAAQQKRIDEMLGFWEGKTKGIKTFSAQFGRWVYDPVFGPKNQAKTFTVGEIRYLAVDRGMIKENEVFEFDKAKQQQKEQMIKAYQAAKSPREKTKLKKQIEEFSIFTQSKAIGEHWVCTGQSIYEYAHKDKKLNEIKLPKDLQGKAIADGPLPFMFGAEADTIKKRFWIRELQRENGEAPYHLELLPKYRGETYSRIRIKLDAKRFLPTEMVLYELNGVGRSSYAFKDLQANSPKHKVGAFLNIFIKPSLPKGYKLVQHNVPSGNVALPNQRQAQSAAPKQR